MAIKPCLECAQPVSTTALTCPNCGARFPTTSKAAKMIFAAVLAVVCMALVRHFFPNFLA